MTTKTRFEIVRARAIDAEAIAEISREHVEYGLAHAWTCSRVRRAMQARETIVLVARALVASSRAALLLRANLAGFAIAVFGDETAHLNLLGVAPRWRRHGVARSLVRWLEESALTAGTPCISLEVRAGNLDAQQFYRACGYAEVLRIPRYYQGVEDAIRMQRRLARM